MPAGSDGAQGTEVSENVGGSISTQLAYLVPSFDPSKDDLQLYQQKVQLVFSAWPPSKINELITRLILNTTGTAFSKLQLHHTELCINDEKGVKRLIELLGGHWGKTGLERRYADAEKALYQCVQQSDESHDSYLARADVLWTRLMSQKLALEDLQAYVTLRGAILSSEDKKRVIIDSDNSLEGKLTMVKVTESIRMLGTSFFQDMTGSNKKGLKAKVYEQSALTVEDVDHTGETEDSAHVVGHDEYAEEDFIENLAQEGDEDAVFVADFETAATDIIQADEDLAAAFTTYMEARRKLSEKYRARGFWPVSKGKSKGFKGKFKGRPTWTSRKTLQQRILESNCRICGRKGHWKSECPNKGQAMPGSSNSSAPVTLSMGVASVDASDALSVEFLNLPEASVPKQDPPEIHEFCFVQTVFCKGDSNGSTMPSPQNISDVRDRIRNHIKGNKGNNSVVASLVHRIESRLTTPSPKQPVNRQASVYRTPVPCAKAPNVLQSKGCKMSVNAQKDAPVLMKLPSPMPKSADVSAEILFATHDTWGILDTGATKTVMGSNFVSSFLQHVDPTIRKKIKRCPCDVTFRFGNQGTLKSEQAMVVPVCGFDLKIAIVPGATPFLVSNTLLRALGAMVATKENRLILPKHDRSIPLKLSNKGLFLIDMNMLMQVQPESPGLAKTAETFAQEATGKMNAEVEPSAADPEISQPKPSLSEAGPQVISGVIACSQESSQLGQDGPKTSNMPTPDDVVKFNRTSVFEESMKTVEKHVEKFDKSNILQKSDSQETSSNVPVSTPVVYHERLGQALAAFAGRTASPGGPIDRASDPRDVAGRDCEVRQDALGENLRRGMGHCPRVDKVVSSALSEKCTPRTSEGDPIPSVEDRGGREDQLSGKSGPCHAQAKGCTQVLGSDSQGATNAKPRNQPREHDGTSPTSRRVPREHDAGDGRGPMGRAGGDGWRHEPASEPHDESGTCTPSDLGSPGPGIHQHHAGDSDDLRAPRDQSD